MSKRLSQPCIILYFKDNENRLCAIKVEIKFSIAIVKFSFDLVSLRLFVFV